MSDGGFEWTIYEIFEITITVSLFLLVGTAIIIAPKIETMQTTAVATELSYVTNLITDTKLEVETKYPELEISLINNNIIIQNIKEPEINIKKEIYGGTHNINKINEGVYCLTSSSVCQTPSSIRTPISTTTSSQSTTKSSKSQNTASQTQATQSATEDITP